MSLKGAQLPESTARGGLLFAAENGLAVQVSDASVITDEKRSEKKRLGIECQFVDSPSGGNKNLAFSEVVSNGISCDE